MQPSEGGPAIPPPELQPADPWHPHLWHPCTQVATARPPERIVRGEGAELITASGTRLIDAISSWWVTLHGHAEASIAQAIADQARTLEQVIFANFTHPGAEALATRLSARSGLERIFFSDNGSTAVEVALKTAWQWWRNQGSDRRQLIAFEGAYHGDTFGAMAVGERSLFSAPYDSLLFAVARSPWPATHAHDDGVEAREREALAVLERLLEVPTAAVILEPLVQGASGMRMVRERVTLAREAIFQGFVGPDPSLTLFHGHSFTANPLGCAAALASLDLLERHPERHEGMEARHRPLLERLAHHPRVRAPRLLGSIAAFDLAVDRPGYLNPAGRQLQARVWEQGVFLRPLGQVVYLLPPLGISDAQLERCYAAIATALDP